MPPGEKIIDYPGFGLPSKLATSPEQQQNDVEANNVEEYTKLYLERDRLRSPNAVSSLGLCGAIRVASGALGPGETRKRPKKHRELAGLTPEYSVSTWWKNLTLVAQNVKRSWSWVCFG